MTRKTEVSERIDLQELVDGGFVLEVNRQFFHPLGMALAYELGDDGKPCSLFVYDWRNDPEGSAFYSLADEGDQDKHDNVMTLWNKKAKVRMIRFGWVIQPMGTVIEGDDGSYTIEYR